MFFPRKGRLRTGFCFPFLSWNFIWWPCTWVLLTIDSELRLYRLKTDIWEKNTLGTNIYRLSIHMRSVCLFHETWSDVGWFWYYVRIPDTPIGVWPTDMTWHWKVTGNLAAVCAGPFLRVTHLPKRRIFSKQNLWLRLGFYRYMYIYILYIRLDRYDIIRYNIDETLQWFKCYKTLCKATT